MKKLLLLFTAISLTVIVKAQTFACNGGVDLNITNAFMGASQPEDTAIDYGCVTATGNHIWYGYFTVCSSGTLIINCAVPTSAVDVNIVVWGPFSSSTIPCSQLNSTTVWACGNSVGSSETVNVANPLQGQVYMVAVVSDTDLVIPSYAASGTAVVTGSCAPVSNCIPTAGYETLCLVTVDSATQEYKMIWTELAGNPASYFGILKADYLGNFQQIDTVQIGSLSQYIDTSANPNLHTEQYSIMTHDTCGTFWGDNGPYIQPVFCQSSLSTQGTVNVAWSPYIDGMMNGPAYYVIYRGATPSNMVSIDTVASFVNNYTDINPLVGNSYYKIGTALYSSCVPMRIAQSAQSQYQVQSYSNAAPITVVGIGENSLQQVSLFPNPSDGNITVKNLTQTSTLRVYDVAGRMVSEMEISSGTSKVALGFLESGIYSVTIENETGFFREEMVIRQ
jgi:hypothetical protein